MAKITMVDVPREDYQVKVEKVLELIQKKTWIMERSGALMHNINMHDKITAHPGGTIFEMSEDDKEFMEDLIHQLITMAENEEEVPVLIINAGLLFWKFSGILWRNRKALQQEEGYKPTKESELLVDVMERLHGNPFIKECIIFNRVASPDQPQYEMSYPENVNILERDGTVIRVPVTKWIV